MSEKLSERMNRDGGHSTVYVPEVAALEQQLAAKDVEIAQLKRDAEIARLLILLRRYTANDHVHGGCDELTQEAEDLIETIDSVALAEKRERLEREK